MAVSSIMFKREVGEGKHMAAEQKMAWARKEFALDSPFFATELFCLDIREATDEDKSRMAVPTMGTDGRTLIWCSEYVDTLDFNGILAVFAHELMHVVGFHTIRIGRRDPIIWNIACDYAINPIVMQAGFCLPDGCLVNSVYEGMDAETIYNHLIKLNSTNMKQLVNQFLNGKNGKGGACGWVMEKKNQDGSEMTDSQKKQAEREQKVVNESATIAHYKMCGKLPSFLERLIGKLREARVNWKEALAQFVEVNSKSDYNWMKPNRRYTKDSLYLPQAYKPEIGNIANLIDTSGSISEQEVKEEISELQGILWAYPGVALHISFFDTKATDFQEVSDDTDIHKLQVVGGGGTDYVAPFKKLEESKIDPVCTIVLTDGYCDTFPKVAPDVPVLWILTTNHSASFKPPFGDVIEISAVPNANETK